MSNMFVVYDNGIRITESRQRSQGSGVKIAESS